MSSSSTYDPTTLQPLLSTIAQVVVSLVLVCFVSTFVIGFDLGSTTSTFARVESRLKQALELVEMGLSSVLTGKAFQKVDWSVEGGNGLLGGTTSSGLVDALGKPRGNATRIKRRYKDTEQGMQAWQKGNVHFPGLLNAAGNLCFLNATLQSMASLPSLLSYLDSIVTECERLDVELPVTETLLSTLEALNVPSSTRPPSLRPVALATALAHSSESRRRLLASSEQQDAHELWGMVRDAVEEEVSKLKRVEERHEQRLHAGLAEVGSLLERGEGENRGASIGNEASATGEGGRTTPTTSGTKTKRTRQAAQNDPWFWLRSQRIKCMTCGYVRDTRHEGEELLMLQVPNVSHCSLYDLLGEYNKPDLLSEYACRKCSMLATLVKYEGQRDRLAGTLTASQPRTSSPSASSPGSRKNAFDLPTQLPSADPEAATKTSKMTASRKDRKRKVQRVVDRVQEVIDAGDYEKDLGPDVKMERTGGAAGKTVSMARTPEILLIHLNRSTHYGYSGPIKNSCNVSFPEYLDLAPFCDNPTPARSPPSSAPFSTPIDPTAPSSTRDLYRLSSLVVHYGSHHFGHYVAFRRNPLVVAAAHLHGPRRADQGETQLMPQWYRVSDETVDVASIDEALRANPFLLFYERVDRGQGDEAGRLPAQREGGEARGDESVAATRGVRPRVVERWRARGRERSSDGPSDPVSSSSSSQSSKSGGTPLFETEHDRTGP